MKRVLTVGLFGLVGATGVAAVTPVRDLPAAMACYNETADRAAELQTLEQLGQSQQASTDDLVTRLTDGRLTLAEAVAILEGNVSGRPVFLEQLALSRPEGTDHDRLAGYLVGRAKERLENDPGLISAMQSRLDAEGK